MLVTLLGSFLGLVLGLVTAGPAGAAFGVVIGTALGLLLAGSGSAVRKAEPGAEIVLERHEILCENKGRVAAATFTREADSGRWLDVTRCSLCDPNGDPQCAKRCLVLIRGVLPAHTHPAHKHA